MVELVSFNINSIDLGCYLSLLDADYLHTLKLVNVGLSDDHLATLVDWIWNKKVERLVLTGNKLTDGCLQLFLNKSLPNMR
jgi:hypothetical protein